MKALHPNHEVACSNGGQSQSQKLYVCPHCEDVGRGNRFKGHHLNRGACEGKGVTNYYAKQFNRGLQNLF